MSVVGVDFGSMNTVIACARNRGVDVITNEVSNRATPSLVGFGPKSRYLGESAKTQEISNLKNTVGSLIRLIGRAFNDPEVKIEQQYVSAPLVDFDGQIGAEVTYLGKKTKFSATQLVAMYLGKIKAIASAELKLPVSDMVISCPVWYTDAQRRTLIDAAEIAGLKVLQLINETTATALSYGITKTDLPEADATPRRVAFIDIGNSNYTCSIVEFRKGELRVRGTACDRHFGGRDFDKALVEHFAKEFKEKYKIDINENLKARVRVATGCEKLKKILSANASAPLNIESLMNDIDVKGFLKREELEELMRPLLDRSIVPIEQALADAKLTAADIDAVELVGGCTRVPALKTAIGQLLNKPLSFTLNQDEAIARGCAFACAIWSPVFRVRDFKMYDRAAYAIELQWEPVPDLPKDEATSLPVFGAGNKYPDTKLVTFWRKKPFDLEARYTDPAGLPGKTNPWLARFSVKGIKPAANDEFMVCKFKAKLDLHGIIRLDQAYWVEDEEVEDPAEKKEDGAEPMETDEKEGEEKKKTVKKVKQVIKGQLPVSSASASLDDTSKNNLMEKEIQMYSEDKLVGDTEEKKNELETFIYELRGKLDEQYAPFASDAEKEKVREKLMQSEDWLYDEGEDATKAVYIAKIEEIRAVAGPIIQRHWEKVEEEKAAARKRDEERAAAKRAELEARRKAATAAEAEKKGEAPGSGAQTPAAKDGDVDMDGAAPAAKDGDVDMDGAAPAADGVD